MKDRQYLPSWFSVGVWHTVCCVGFVGGGGGWVFLQSQQPPQPACGSSTIYRMLRTIGWLEYKTYTALSQKKNRPLSFWNMTSGWFPDTSLENKPQTWTAYAEWHLLLLARGSSSLNGLTKALQAKIHCFPDCMDLFFVNNRFFTTGLI